MYKLIFFLSVIFISPSFAQTNFLRSPSSGLHAINKQQPFVFSFSEKGQPVLIPCYFDKKNSQYHFEAIHYTAFFCKMELKAVNHCNVWIKIHAGDYDKYAFGNSQ